MERPPGRLDHLRERPECRPVQGGVERLHLRSRHAGVLGVGAVELATHPAHRGGYTLAGRELTLGRGLDHADSFNPETAGKRDGLS